MLKKCTSQKKAISPFYQDKHQIFMLDQTNEGPLKFMLIVLLHFNFIKFLSKK